MYAGTLHADRFDVDLTAQTARALGDDATVVLVGPNLLEETRRDARLSAGVVLLGPRSPDELVAYLQHADALIVPHLVDAFTDSLDPIKLYEYQAVGRPVVSTPVAGFRESDSPLISITESAAFGTAVAARCIALHRKPTSGPSTNGPTESRACERPSRG